MAKILFAHILALGLFLHLTACEYNFFGGTYINNSKLDAQRVSLLKKSGWIPNCLPNDSVESEAHDLDTNQVLLKLSGNFLVENENDIKLTRVVNGEADFPTKHFVRTISWFPNDDDLRSQKEIWMAVYRQCSTQTLYLTQVRGSFYGWMQHKSPGMESPGLKANEPRDRESRK